MHVKSAETFILCTLADSVNFSCSGRLCSSYSTTPSGPLADAGLPSLEAPPRPPLAASSWVSRRLQATRTRSQKDQRNSAIGTRYGCTLLCCCLCCWTCSLLNIGCFPTVPFCCCFPSEKYSQYPSAPLQLVPEYLPLQQSHASNKYQLYCGVLVISLLIYPAGKLSHITSGSFPSVLLSTFINSAAW